MTGLEFFIFGLVKAALTGAATGAALALVTIAYLNWDRIVGWLQSRAQVITQGKDRVGFSLVDRLQNGNYRTVYGIINRRSGLLLDGEAVTSRTIDAQTAAEHRNGEILIY
ncbi:hypothetical protein [Pelobacter propionicus]|uniref:Uncharacterized protein n=1 Tax=Pelobacter propionicus (strain DSM 2379 / NBRC 103807 / OttBd1) TaxID=338966 RepID=A1AKD6_PELPD|nr:hypothetical protein [Pelobacter propionicus]ABK97806.1 hypothetical protein Ppro_0170 [Pelobacter propionicus DSM 2379]